MSESPRPEIDPDSTQPLGDVNRFARRRVGSARIALAALLAVLITAAGATILAVLLWASASVFH